MVAERRWYPPRPTHTARRAAGSLPVVAQRTCTCVNHYCRHHQALRAQWAPSVAADRVSCWRCGERIAPTDHWDLGHADEDKRIYRGPECRPCNRATASRKPETTRQWLKL